MQIYRILISLLIITSLFTCNTQISKLHTKASQNPFNEAKSFFDIFEFEIVFPLEPTEEAFFDLPKVALMVESGYFFSNDQGSEIYRYHQDGSFDRTIARKGTGPGEIHKVSFAARIYNNKIGFWDLYKGSILVFHSDGTFEYELDIKDKLSPFRMIATGASFAWPEEETLILGNVTALDQPNIQALSLKLKRDDKNNISIARIDKVLCVKETNYDLELGSKINSTLTQVGPRFWLGNEYVSSFALLDPAKQGNPAKFRMIQFPEALTPEDYETLDPNDRRARFRLINLKGTVFNIMPLDPFVFVQVGALGFVPFDQSGNQLAEKRIKCHVSALADTYKDTALFVTTRKGIQKLEIHFNFELFEESPYDIGDDDQPYLVRMRLKEKFRKP